jgi:hypothetical protein
MNRPRFLKETQWVEMISEGTFTFLCIRGLFDVNNSFMLKVFGSEDMRQFHSFFNLAQNMIAILCVFCTNQKHETIFVLICRTDLQLIQNL